MKTLRKIVDKVDVLEAAMDNGNPIVCAVMAFFGFVMFYLFAVVIFSL